MHNTHYRLNEPHVIGEVLEGELVLVHFASGCYFSLQGTAADICNLLRAGRTTEQVGVALASHHQLSEEDMAAAVGAFVERLVQEELLVPAESPPASEANIGPVAATFSPPVLEKFDDMAEQLLLDPIHEIDQSNWLVRQSA
jgi:hypothetical protein